MGYDLIEYLTNQREWSEATFGPGERTAGCIDHIRKECIEVESDPTDLKEWVDIVTLALDGAWRAGHLPPAIAAQLWATLERNKNRKWPDWRTADPTKAIEHVRDEYNGTHVFPDEN